jgi:hypothetical protein
MAHKLRAGLLLTVAWLLALSFSSAQVQSS